MGCQFVPYFSPKIISLLLYLTTLPATQDYITSNNVMIVNNEFIRTWKEEEGMRGSQ
jgi:hypothetical protein